VISTCGNDAKMKNVILLLMISIGGKGYNLVDSSNAYISPRRTYAFEMFFPNSYGNTTYKKQQTCIKQ
jgi:hypothetical protein